MKNDIFKQWTYWLTLLHGIIALSCHYFGADIIVTNLFTYTYGAHSLFLLIIFLFSLHQVYCSAIIDALFIVIHGLAAEFTKEEIDKVRGRINDRYFVGEGQLLFFLFLILAIGFEVLGQTGLCQLTLCTIICLRIMALCIKSLFIGILKDLDCEDLAEKSV